MAAMAMAVVFGAVVSGAVVVGGPGRPSDPSPMAITWLARQ